MCEDWLGSGWQSIENVKASASAPPSHQMNVTGDVFPFQSARTISRTTTQPKDDVVEY